MNAVIATIHLLWNRRLINLLLEQFAPLVDSSRATSARNYMLNVSAIAIRVEPSSVEVHAAVNAILSGTAVKRDTPRTFGRVNSPIDLLP